MLARVMFDLLFCMALIRHKGALSDLVFCLRNILRIKFFSFFFFLSFSFARIGLVGRDIGGKEIFFYAEG